MQNIKIFLFGISYYGALGASREYVMKGLEDMRRPAPWSNFGNDVSANQTIAVDGFSIKYQKADCIPRP